MSSQAVAISTTGHEHRLGFLETSVRLWDEALSPGDSLFVTVDGTEQDAANVAEVVKQWTGSVFRVGMHYSDYASGITPVRRRLGVAVNKNTGLELMMDATRADHLFLSDDDCGPRNSQALLKHTGLYPNLPHSMVCWGAHRLIPADRPLSYAEWTWPRGVMLYTHRTVVDKVGGMVEAFGPGGHEHAEWSRRIHQHGLTPAPYCSPVVYAMYSVAGQAQRADRFWLAEDMRKLGETGVELGHRRKAISSIRKEERDYLNANSIMTQMDGDTKYVPFRAHDNGRASASLSSTSTGLGAGGDL